MAGKIATSKWTRGACERQLYDLERWNTKDQPYSFDAAAAERVCQIVGNMPHIKGVWAQRQEHIELAPWQAFILSTVFGWKRTIDGYWRFRTVYIECPRKNAKSTLSSAVGLVLLACDGEPGALVVSAATTRQQAKLVFSDAQAMARREPGFRELFDVSVFAHAISVLSASSKFEALSAEDSNLDGLNVHGAIIDELHAHKTRGVWDVLETATGARAQPLIWAITTAGVNRSGICYEQHHYVQKILDRHFENDSYFGIIYTIDDSDINNWLDEDVWRKANPNFGISIYPDTIAFAARKAEQLPAAKNTFLQKHLNVWTSADFAWMPMHAWQACTDKTLDIEDFAGESCYLGVDLANRNDIAAVAILFPPAGQRDYYSVFCKYYLPERAIEVSPNSQYSGWERQGLITATPGDTTDYEFIVADMLDLDVRYDIRSIGLDPHQALSLVNSLRNRGLNAPMEYLHQRYSVLSPPMKELEALVLQKRIRHTGDPVLAWMISNVVAQMDEYENIKPVKERYENKIDGVIATLLAFDRDMKNEPTPDYEKRGLYLI